MKHTGSYTESALSGFLPLATGFASNGQSQARFDRDQEFLKGMVALSASSSYFVYSLLSCLAKAKECSNRKLSVHTFSVPTQHSHAAHAIYSDLFTAFIFYCFFSN